jgi:hypothetical protein
MVGRGVRIAPTHHPSTPLTLFYPLPISPPALPHCVRAWLQGYRRALDKERADRAAERAAAGITEEEAKRATELRDEDLRV